jgi:hypothetical protein
MLSDVREQSLQARASSDNAPHRTAVVHSIVAVRGLISPYQHDITEFDAGDFILVLGISVADELNDAPQTTRRAW